MALTMNLKKILCMTTLAIAGVLGVVFLIDLAIGIPFDRSDIVTDILVAVAAGLLIWQGIETYREIT
jgi:hypothetical protein